MKRFLRDYAGAVALSALAAGAFVYVAIVDKGNITTNEATGRRGHVLPAFRRADLTRLKLTSAGGSLIFRKVATGAGNSWVAEGAPEFVVDDAAVEALLLHLDQAKYVRKVDSPASEPAVAEVAMDMGTLHYRLLVGAVALEPRGERYVRLEQEGVPPAGFLVAREIAEEMTRPLDAYGDHHVAPYLGSELKALRVRGPDVSWEIERLDDISFRFSPDTAGVPRGARVSRDGLERVWQALGNMRVEKVLPEEMRPLSPEMTWIEMTPLVGERSELLVGPSCPGSLGKVVVQRGPPLPRLNGCTSNEILANLSIRPEKWVDRRLYAARYEEVSEVRIVGGRERAIFARKGTGWHSRAPTERDLLPSEVDAVNDWVKRLVEIEGVPETAHGRNAPPLWTGILGHGDPMVDEKVDLFDVDGALLAYRGSDTVMSLRMLPSVLPLLRKGLERFGHPEGDAQ